MPALPDLILVSVPSAAGLERIAAMLDGGEKPALVLGTGRRQCRRLGAQRSRWPRNAGRACGPRHTTRAKPSPKITRSSPASCPPGATRSRDLLDPHDAILVVGAPVFTYHVEGSGPHWPEHAKLMALSDDPQHLAAMPGGGGVLGDVGGRAGAAGRDGQRAAVHRQAATRS